MKQLLFIILISLFTPCVLPSEVFPGRDASLPAAAKLEKGWSALVREGSIRKALNIFESIPPEQNMGPSLYMGLETVYNFQNRFTRSAAAAARGFRACRTSPWAEIFLYDAVNLHPVTRDMDTVYGLLGEITEDSEVSCFLRDYALFELAKEELRRGRQDESRSLYSRMQFVRKGVYCGPFYNRDGSGFKKQYAPERMIRLDGEYRGINRNVGWFRYETPHLDGYMDYSAMFYPFANAVAYGLYSVYVPEAGEYLIHAGTGNALKIWVNYSLIFSSDDTHKLFFDRYVLRTSLIRGWNLIAVKLGTSENDTEWGLYLRVSGKEGRPVKKCKADFAGSERIGSGVFSGTLRKADVLQTPAEEYFSSVIAQDPENSMALGTLGFVYSQRSRGDAGEKQDLKLFAQALEKAPLCPLWGELAGAVDDNFNRTLQTMEGMLQRNPDAVSIREKICSTLYSHGFRRACEKRFKQFADVPADRLGYVYYLRGRLYRGRGWGIEAHTYFTQAAEQLPRFLNSYKAAAHITGDRKESEMILETLLTRDCTDAYAHEQLALSAHKQGRFKQAEQHYRKIIEYHPSYLKAYYLLSGLYTDAGDEGRTLDVLEKAERIFPQYPSIKEEIGKIHKRQGRELEGKKKIQEALHIDPNLAALKEYVRFLSPEQKEFYTEWDFSGTQALASYAGDKQYEGFNSVDIRSVEAVRVHSNGTEDRMVHKLRKALTDTGVGRLKTVRIPFSLSRNRIEIKHARIIKPDGRVIQSSRVFDHSGVSTGSGGAALYSSYHIKSIQFPELRKGDCIDYQYVIHDTSPGLFTDEFSDMSFLVSLPPAEHSQYILQIPADMKLNAGTFNTKIRPDISRTGGIWVYSWDLSGWPGIILEKSMRPLTEYVPYIVVSTMESWKKAGTWYSYLMKDQARCSEEMKKKAAELCRGLAGDTRKAEALFSYVRDEIRYVGIEFGRSSMKPHRAETTFSTRYGDCKDTAVLLMCLLREAGIASNVVLVRTQDMGRIARSIASPYLFNHAVCLIPDLDGKQVWLDGTSDFYRMEEIPWADLNALALIVDDSGGTITEIPDEPAGTTGVRIKADITLKPDGSAFIDISEHFLGQRAPVLRRYVHSSDRFKQYMEALYARKFNGFTLESFKTSDPQRIVKEPWYRIRGTVKRYGLTRGNRIICPCSLNPLSLSEKIAEKERTYPLWLRIKMFQDEHITLKVPEGYRTAFYPENKKNVSANGEFEQTVMLKGRTVSVHTRFAVTDTNVQPQQYGKYKEFCRFVDSATEERIICDRE